MIVGVGCDIAKISRFENKDDAFIHRILTDAEFKQYQTYKKQRRLEYLAGRFAAKEALIKAMDRPCGLMDFTILYDDKNKPTVHIKGYSVFLSIAHEHEYAIAYALIQK